MRAAIAAPSDVGAPPAVDDSGCALTGAAAGITDSVFSNTLLGMDDAQADRRPARAIDDTEAARLRMSLILRGNVPALYHHFSGLETKPAACSSA